MALSEARRRGFRLNPHIRKGEEHFFGLFAECMTGKHKQCSGFGRIFDCGCYCHPFGTRKN